MATSPRYTLLQSDAFVSLEPDMSTANSTMIPPNLQFFTREQAAQYIGVRPQTLASWATHRRYGLPLHKIGRLVRYARADLDRWLATRRRGGEAT